MAWMSISSLFSLILFLIIIKNGCSIKCLVCNSRYDEDCENLPDKQGLYVQECHSSQKMCRKIVQEVSEDLRVIRQCATRGSNGCSIRRGTNEIRVEHCECDTPLCNHGNMLLKPRLISVLCGTFICFIFRILSYL